MRRPPIALCFSLIVLTACGGGSGGSGNGTPTPAPTPTTPADWTQSWTDEFNGAAGAPVDASKWQVEVKGNNDNNELQYYTDRPSNLAQDGQGHLVITALAETYTGSGGTRSYTSARLNTAGRYEPTHGKFEARLRIPRGKGLWPAFWLLGANIGSVPWPGCGEIDIMENVGDQPNTVVGSMHGPGFFGATPKNAAYSISAPFADDFHVFGLDWQENSIRWYVDENLYQSRTPADLGAGQTWVFEHSFFIILNVAVGGDWPGSPNASTTFPQTMAVDYVRVTR
jgi:beta-glucanase (GH16 family)